MLRMQNCNCPACAVTGAGNADTKRDTENSFSGTQMFVQARNYECPQQMQNQDNKNTSRDREILFDNSKLKTHNYYKIDI